MRKKICIMFDISCVYLYLIFTVGFFSCKNISIRYICEFDQNNTISCLQRTRPVYNGHCWWSCDFLLQYYWSLLLLRTRMLDNIRNFKNQKFNIFVISKGHTGISINGEQFSMLKGLSNVVDNLEYCCSSLAVFFLEIVHGSYIYIICQQK